MANAWQLQGFKTLSPTFDPATTLFTVWFFPNDVFYYYSTGKSAGTYAGVAGSPTTSDQIPGLAVNNVLSTVDELVANGAQHFLVGNSPDLSKTPTFLNTPLAPTVAGLVKDFNDGLASSLAAYGALHPQLDITLFNTEQALNTIIQNPSTYGLSNVTQPCLDATQLTLCSDPSTYLFWDVVHPTTKVHSILAQAMVQAVPGPAPALGALAAFRWSRRMRKRLRAISSSEAG